MAVYNLGTARGNIEIDTNDLKNADIAIRSAGTSLTLFGAAALGAFGYVIGVGAKFEKEMSFVAAVTNASTEELNKLSAAAIELGKQGPFGPREVAAGFVDLAKAGLSAQEIVDGVGEAAVHLAAAGDIPFTESAETLVNIMRTFNIEAKDVTPVIDSIAGAANASTVDISDMATSLKYAGAPAAALGFTIDELNTAIGILGNRGIRGSTAGTSLRRVFLQLANPTKVASDRMKELGLLTEDGANAFFDANGQAKDLSEIFQILQTATAGLTDKDKIAALNDIFGARAVNSALILMEQGAEGFAAFNEQMLGVSAAEVAEKRMDNLSGAVMRLKAALEATFIQAGSPFQNFLKDLVENVRSLVLWFGNLPSGLQTFILGSIAVIGVLSLLSGAFLLTVGNIVRAIRVIGELGHAAQVIGPLIKGLVLGLRALSVAFLTNPVTLIIAAIVALGVAFYMLYTRSEGFRNFIDKTWQTIQKIWDDILNFVRKIPQFFRDAWDEVKRKTDVVWDSIREKVSSVLEAILGFFRDLPGKAVRAVGALGEAIKSGLLTGLNALGDFFLSLPGLIGRALASALKAIVGFVTKIPFLFGYAIGFIIGLWVRMGIILVETAINLVKQVVTQLTKLPGLFVDIFTGILNFVLTWGAQLLQFMWDTFTTLVKTVFDFLTQLPGIALTTLTTVMTTFFNWGVQLLQLIWNTFLNLVGTVVSFLSQLPGKVWEWVTNALNELINLAPRFLSTAQDIGGKIVNGIMDIVTGLPGKVGDILGDVIDAFTGLISKAFNAAKDFAGGLWRGFKKGLGIGSPSYIEHALWAIQGVAKTAATDLRSQVHTMQGLSRGIPSILPDLGTLGTIGAGVALPAGQVIHNYNAPLIGAATIRNDSDIVLLARELDTLQRTTSRGRGER